jgi:hypothetical protein
VTASASPPKARIRPALADDFERVYPLLRQLNDTRITRTVWQRLFAPLWRGADYCPGYVLVDDAVVVGFIGTLYSEREIQGQVERLCNLTSWVVLPEYRSQSVMMLMPILRDKSVTLTSLTSSEEAYAVYQKLGFKDLDTQARVMYRFPLFRSRRYQFWRGSDCVARLDDSQRAIYRDHQDFDVLHYLLQADTGQCYMMLECKRGRAHVHYVSDMLWFRQHVGRFRHGLLAQLQLKTLQVDERVLGGMRIAASRAKVFDQPKQFRSRSLDVDHIDALYSELVVLATP